jgi:hypothetical protein
VRTWLAQGGDGDQADKDETSDKKDDFNQEKSLLQTGKKILNCCFWLRCR